MTGRYPSQTGVMRNNVKLRRSEECVAESLRANGYATQHIGKWHLDDGTPDFPDDPGWVAPGDRQGFSLWTAFNHGHIYYDGKFYVNSDPNMRTIPDGVYEPDWQTQRAIQFIRQCAGRPFFLTLSMGTPHPCTWGPGQGLPPGGDYVYPYDPGTLTLRPNVEYDDLNTVREEYANYYGMISNLDWNVGRSLDQLDVLGLADDTIVVVTSDHGDLLGSHFGASGHLRGKAKIYTEALNVPFMLRFPEAVQPQAVHDVFNSVDIMPTLLGLSGLPVPDTVMGRDFSPLLTEGAAPLNPAPGPVPSTESALVGMFDSDWVGVRSPGYSLECDQVTLEPRLLFHNTADPYQFSNLVDDPAYEKTRGALLIDVQDWLAYVQGPA